MTNTLNDTIARSNALADIALGIIRDLRDMRHPSISRNQIRNRVIDYFDDAPCATIDIDHATLDIASHPAIRTAIRP